MISIIYPYSYTFRVVHHYAEMAAKVRKKRGQAKVRRQPAVASLRFAQPCSAEGEPIGSPRLRANLRFGRKLSVCLAEVVCFASNPPWLRASAFSVHPAVANQRFAQLRPLLWSGPLEEVRQIHLRLLLFPERRIDIHLRHLDPLINICRQRIMLSHIL